MPSWATLRVRRPWATAVHVAALRRADASTSFPAASAGSSGFENAFEALPADTTLLEACKHLGTMNVHRIPVLKDGKLCNFITQVLTSGQRVEHRRVK